MTVKGLVKKGGGGDEQKTVRRIVDQVFFSKVQKIKTEVQAFQWDFRE